MAGHIEHIGINGLACHALVIPLVGGLRIQVEEADWNLANAFRSIRVVVQRPQQEDVWMVVANERRLSPIVWVTLAEKMNIDVRLMVSVPDEKELS